MVREVLQWVRAVLSHTHSAGTWAEMASPLNHLCRLHHGAERETLTKLMKVSLDSPHRGKSAVLVHFVLLTKCLSEK
jgi:hypothetical protein